MIAPHRWFARIAPGIAAILIAGVFGGCAARAEYVYDEPVVYRRPPPVYVARRHPHRSSSIGSTGTTTHRLRGCIAHRPRACTGPRRGTTSPSDHHDRGDVIAAATDDRQERRDTTDIIIEVEREHSSFVPSLRRLSPALFTLALGLSGCTIEHVHDDVGLLTVQWSLDDSFDPDACLDYGSRTIELVVYDRYDDVVEQFEARCADFATSIELEDGAYGSTPRCSTAPAARSRPHSSWRSTSTKTRKPSSTSTSRSTLCSEHAVSSHLSTVRDCGRCRRRLDRAFVPAAGTGRARALVGRPQSTPVGSARGLTAVLRGRSSGTKAWR